MQISLKVHEDMNIGGLVAPVILAMVGLNFVKNCAVGGDVVQDLAHAVFILSKTSYSTKQMVFLHFSMTASFWLGPTVLSMTSQELASQAL
jgi:hypothetical protein